MTRLLCRSQPIDWSRLPADPVGLLLLVGTMVIAHLGSPSAGPAGRRSAANRFASGLCSTLQLRPVPGSPTVVQGAPERVIGMLKDTPGPPREIELRPLLPKLKRRGLSGRCGGSGRALVTVESSASDLGIVPSRCSQSKREPIRWHPLRLPGFAAEAQPTRHHGDECPHEGIPQPLRQPW